MMRLRPFLLPLGVVGLAACDPSTLFEEDVIVMLAPEASELAPDAAGDIDVTLVNALSGGEVVGGNGYGFAVGYLPDDPGAVGYAGLTAATDLGPQGPNGTASMSGTYEVARIDQLDLNAVQNRTGENDARSRTITLAADFDAETLTGTDGDLTIDATMAAGALSGTATFDGLDGTLTGAIGETEAIGAFFGSDANTVFAGGFYVRE